MNLKLPALLLTLTASAHAADLASVADGKTDATAVLQQMIDSGMGDIELPKGSYLLTKTLTVDLDKTGYTSFNGHGVSRLIMSGPGPAIHFVGTHAGSAAPSTVKPNVYEKQRTPMVDAVEIIGAHEEADGIEATGTMQLTVSRTTVRDCRHCVHLTVLNRNFIVTDCHFYNNRGIGVFYDNVNLHQSIIVGTHISYCKGGGVVKHGGNVRNVQIGTCDIEANMSADSPPTANVWLDSTGGSIGEVTITGCTLQHSSKAPGCANIRIQGAGEDPALERRTGGKNTREGNVTITGNVLSDIQTNIDIQDSRGVTVTGNTFWEGFQHALVVERSSHIVVASNNFDRNPRYAVNGFNAAENNGLLFKDCSECMIQGNVISGVMRQRAALDISNGSRLNIAHNSVFDSDGVGILLENVKQSLIDGCLVRDDREESVRSKEPSLKIVGGADNQIGSNLLGNGKVLSKE